MWVDVEPADGAGWRSKSFYSPFLSPSCFGELLHPFAVGQLPPGELPPPSVSSVLSRPSSSLYSRSLNQNQKNAVVGQEQEEHEQEDMVQEEEQEEHEQEDMVSTPKMPSRVGVLSSRHLQMPSTLYDASFRPHYSSHGHVGASYV